MAAKDYTGQMIETLRMFRPDIRPIDFSNVLDNFNNAYDKAYNKSLNNAYSDALASGDEERASKIAAMLDPAGERAMKQALKQREEDRQWALEDDARKYQQALDLERVKNNNAIGLAKLKAGLAASAGGQDTTAMRNINYLISQGYSPQEAAALYYGGQNSTLNLATLGQKGQEAYDKEVGKYLAEEATANKQMQTLKPKAENAIRRAREALNQGEGLGQIGGKFWTTGQGGKNRANIKNAQAQINTAMRGLLKQMGVGSTELNSAVEAEGYRYQINPDTPIAQQEQVLNNFVEDYMSGALAKDLQEIYGKKPSLKDFQTKDWSNASNEDLLKGL